MNYTLVCLAILALGLAGCGRDAVNVSEGGKREGPPVSTLSHGQLMDAYHDCTQYGAIDDPNVKYTVRYCAAIQSAHLSEGYSAPGTAKVDPTLNKMH
jgi:hypothetical protein